MAQYHYNSMAKRLGQNFLKNKGKIRKIVDSLELKKGDLVVEIGPGHGELTELLASSSLVFRTVAIEKDAALVRLLKEKFSVQENVEVVEGDILKVLPEITDKLMGLKAGSYKVVGNIPYYITGKLLRTLGDLLTGVVTRHRTPPISLIVLTVQKEVAERMAAKPPKMNLLAASVQFWAEPEIVDFISKKDFKPQPEVDSAIVKVITKNKQLTTEAENYYKLIKILFKQPRKTILNNLQASLGSSKDEVVRRLGEAGINPADRPQNLKIKEISNLARFLREKDY